jgi:hypothetical protein
MDLRDFNKRLTDLVEQRENDVNNVSFVQEQKKYNSLIDTTNFIKHLTNLVEQRENDVNNISFVQEKKNNTSEITSYMAIQEHGRPFSLMAVQEHGRPFDKPKLFTRMAIGEHGRPFDFEKELQKQEELQEEFLYNLRKLKK